MTSFTTNKHLETPANGEYVDQWEVPLNGDMTIIDAALGGVTSLNATSGSANLSIAQYQKLALNITGAISANVTYTIPSGVGGNWIVRNATTDATGGPWTVTIASGGGGSNVVALRGKNVMIWSDGTNVRDVNENVESIGTVTSVGVSGGATGLTTSNSPVTTSGTITLGGVLNVASGGTNLTAFGTGVSGALSANVTGSGGMVLQSNATLITPALGTPTSGNLVNTTGLPIANTTGTLTVDRGGTGATTLTANNLVVGNGTSAVNLLAPGSSGNVVTSNGTTWVSQALPTTAPNTQTFTANGTWTKPTGNYSTVQIQIWGAGGGGGRGGDTSSVATGGGGGSFSVSNLPISLIPNSTATVVIGQGGAGGSSGTSAGSNGTDTYFTFNGVVIGNAGGKGGNANATPTAIAGGKGGVSGTGYNPSPIEDGGDGGGVTGINENAQPGTSVTFSSGGGGSVNATTSTAGGTSIYGGNGGAGGSDSVNGGNGTDPGGGGGATETGTGGKGGNGKIIVVTF